MNYFKRNYEIAGHTTPDSHEPEGGFVKAHDEMYMYGAMPSRFVSQIMNTRGGLCYEYV